MSSEAARPGGLFDRLGSIAVRWPLLVIAFWIAFAGALALLFPPLMEAAAKNQTPALPNDAPTMAVAKQMSKAFGESGKGSQLLVILTDENGLSPADFETYRTLVDKLHQEKQLSVQDIISAPPLREILASKDNKAWNLPITIPADVTDPATKAAYARVTQVVNQTVAGTTLSAHFAGATASILDLNSIGLEDAHLIEIGTAVSVLAILLMVYRNVIAMLVPLATIGLSVATAQGVLSGLSELGLHVQTETIIFMTAVMIGAGTDYAVFLISRYHDYVRQGLDSDQAVKNALMSIGKVIAASAATVAVTFLAMIFARLSLFSSIGPAISISVFVALLAAVTLLPAILVLIGRRGWINPRRDLTHRMWRKTGIRIVRRPWIHLVASLIVLTTLASCTLLVRFNYDDLKTLPRSAPSVSGSEMMDRHFSPNMMTPMVLLVQSPRDLRMPAALADLEQVAQRISQLPNITTVRGLTRPAGQPLEQTKVSFQAGEVGGKLNEASTQINDHGGDLDKLTDGSKQLADALAAVRVQVTQAVASAGTLVSVLTTMKQLIGGDKTLNDIDQTAKLVGRMRALGASLASNMVDVANTAAWATPLLNALNTSPVCNEDPACASSRGQLQALVNAQNSGSLNSISALAQNLQQTQEVQTVGHTIDQLEQFLNQAVSTLRSVDGLGGKLNQMQQGADALAQGSRAVAQGVQALVDQVKKMGVGLNEASAFLLAMKHDANRPSMSGFNIPPQALAADEFKKGAQIFISPDGHAARYFVQSGLKASSTEAIDQVEDILKAARSAQPNSELSDATINLAGLPSGLRDMRDYYNHDIIFIVFATIVIVFLILVILLRAIVAPLYLIGSVLVSFLSALGLGVIVFQLILGIQLHWSLPGLSFILLVAIGADYNMLLISRIRDESPHGVRVGVIRTVASTGGVITSAGLIFAASMFGLMAASITTMLEVGFIIGSGILIDTFLVRSITVPALAALIGQANWWPSKLGANTNQRKWVTQPRRVQKADRLSWLNRFPFRKTHVPSLPPASSAASDCSHPSGGNLRGAVTVNGIGDDPLDDLDGQALPLFGSIVLPREVAKMALDQATSASPIWIDGGRQIDDLDGQALPVFGTPGLSAQLIKFRKAPRLLATATNGHSNGHSNGHTNGHVSANGEATDLIDDPDGHALPLFGPTRMPAAPSQSTKTETKQRIVRQLNS
jgi:RND superfamily putative drug exporter